MRWDLYCRVIDNHGDAGVCWRFATDLAARGEQVRLWIDDPSPLAWMAPGGAAGVEVVPWRNDDPLPAPEPGDVVVEAFGCDPPAAMVRAMAARAEPPVWINLEYLSAEDWVERAHGLPSPQLSGPGLGLVKHFYFPGFTPRTGGLLREPGLLQARERFDGDAWLAGHGHDVTALIAVVSADNLSGGIASAAFIAYLSGLTNVQYSATQYALFSSMMLLAPKWLAGFSGVAVDAVGYGMFFTGTAVLGVPVLVLIWFVMKKMPSSA